MIHNILNKDIILTRNMGWVMKKILICVLLLFCLTSCDKTDDKDYKKELVDYSSALTKYSLEAQMKVVKNEGEVSFDVAVDYLQPNYYKVKLQNKQNNNIQVILKNNDGVFVITPALNKQFQFNSDWPLNSSHAYLLQSIIKDITNDPESILTTDEDTYTITSAINTKTNARLKMQKTTFDKKTNAPIKNVLTDGAQTPLVTVDFKKFNSNPNLKVSDFNADVVNNTIKLEMSEGKLEGVLNECVPTFMPEGYRKDQSLIRDEYTVYTYVNQGSIYTITTIVTLVSDVLTVSREYEDIVLLENCIGFVNGNSVSFFSENLFVSIYNEDFNLEEAILIANSFKTDK